MLHIERKSESEVAQSCPTLCNPMNCSLPASPSMGFSRQGYWSGLPFPSPGDLPNPGIEPGSPALQADTLPSEPQIIPFLLFWGKKKKQRERTFLIGCNKCLQFQHPFINLVASLVYKQSNMFDLFKYLLDLFKYSACNI